MLCGSTQKLKKIDVDSAIIDDDSIEISDTISDLGFFLEKNLNMNAHVTSLRKSCYNELRKISHIRPFIDEHCAKQLIISLVILKLDYCNCLFFNMSNDNFHKLQLVQNHAARIVKRASKRSSATTLLYELHWLPIKQRVSYKIALTVFKCLNIENFPSYLKELVTLYSPKRSLRSSEQYFLAKPFKKLSIFGHKTFHFAAPEVLNSLPLEIRSCSSLPVFKKKLKTYFFSDSFLLVILMTYFYLYQFLD